MKREEWDLWTRGAAMRRAGYAGFKRNVTVALRNWLAEFDEPPEAAVAALREALAEGAAGAGARGVGARPPAAASSASPVRQPALAVARL